MMVPLKVVLALLPPMPYGVLAPVVDLAPSTVVLTPPLSAPRLTALPFRVCMMTLPLPRSKVAAVLPVQPEKRTYAFVMASLALTVPAKALN